MPATRPTQSPVGGQAIETRKVKQRVAPSGLIADGYKLELLGTVTVTGGQLSVKLANCGNGPAWRNPNV